MTEAVLDNPVWSALTTYHTAFAETAGEVKRYPALVAPFCAVSQHNPISDPWCIQEDQDFVFMGTIPTFPPEWHLNQRSSILQMILRGQVERVHPHLEEGVLGESDAHDMQELMDLVFPGYYRTNTFRLGLYIGLRRDGRLIAMAGERLAMPGYREISAVATHPDYVGQGYAQQLIKRLARNILDQGMTPFLHVSMENERARRIYERLGFVTRSEIELVQVRHSKS